MDKHRPDLRFSSTVKDRRSRCWRVRAGTWKRELFIEREGLEDFSHLNLHESGQWHVKVKRKYVVQVQLHVEIVP